MPIGTQGAEAAAYSNPYTAGAKIASDILSGMGAGPSSVSSNPFQRNQSNFNINPVGVNLGELFKNYNSGPPENGGLWGQSELFTVNSPRASSGGFSVGVNPMMLLAVGAIVVLLVAMKR